MTERTFTLEAGTAVEVQAEDVGLVREGRCEAVQCDDRPVERGGHMHQAGVIADDQFSHGQQIDGLGQRGGAAQVAAKPGRELGNFFGNGMVFGRPEQPDGVTLFGETLGQRCKVRGRPAFGRAEFGSWTKRDYAGRTVKFELGQGLSGC